jgi:hypothetical protein
MRENFLSFDAKGGGHTRAGTAAMQHLLYDHIKMWTAPAANATVNATVVAIGNAARTR